MLGLRKACVGGDQRACAQYKEKLTPCGGPGAVVIEGNNCATEVTAPVPGESGQSHAQGAQTGPGGARVPGSREDMRVQMLELRKLCVGGDQSACAKYKEKLTPCGGPRAVVIEGNNCTEWVDPVPIEIRERMLGLRKACVGGDQRACAQYKEKLTPCSGPRAVVIEGNTCAVP